MILLQLAVLITLCFIPLDGAGEFDSLVGLYSQTTNLFVAGNYLGINGKGMFEKVGLFNSLTLAKNGQSDAAREEMQNMMVQVMAYDLPNTLRQTVGLWDAVEFEDRSFFKDTIEASDKRLKKLRTGIDAKLKQFEAASPKPPKDVVKKEIKQIITDGGASTKQHVLDALNNDMRRLRNYASGRVSALKIRAKKILPKINKIMGKLKPGAVSGVGVIDPLVDIVGIGLSIKGLIGAVKDKDTKGIVLNTIGLIGSVVGVASWVLVAFNFAWAGPLGATVGLVAALATIITDLFWPRNLAIESANQLSEIAFDELNSAMEMFKTEKDDFDQSLGWVYQGNTGIFIRKKITPDAPVTFRQSLCSDGTTDPATSCAPMQISFKNKQYLALGIRRQSTDSRAQFQLQTPYDFIGKPKSKKFCGNTIVVDAIPFYKYIKHLDRDYFKWEIKKHIGYHMRNMVIDTSGRSPAYTDVDTSQFNKKKRSLEDEKDNKDPLRKKKKVSKKNSEKKHRNSLKDFRMRFRKNPRHHRVPPKSQNKLYYDDSEKCSPESDRIVIDDLTELEPNSGNINIKTGPGKDSLTIGGMIGPISSSREDFLQADLGDDDNMLAVGSLVNIGKRRDDLVAGVHFDNTGNDPGKLCFIEKDLVNTKCVGKVTGVTMFQGSRMHDTVMIGGRGPYTIIQNYGANEYHLIVGDIENYMVSQWNDDALKEKAKRLRGCPPGWVFQEYEERGVCFTAVDLERTWDDAQAYCRERNGYLADIQTDQEADILAELQKGKRNGEFWIGLRKTDNEFKWTEGDVVSSPTYWKDGEPSSGDCVANKDKSWVTKECSQKLPFTCYSIAAVVKYEIMDNSKSRATMKIYPTDDMSVDKNIKYFAEDGYLEIRSEKNETVVIVEFKEYKNGLKPDVLMEGAESPCIPT